MEFFGMQRVTDAFILAIFHAMVAKRYVKTFGLRLCVLKQ